MQICRAITRVQKALQRQAVVALVGPQQVGQSTLALEVAATRPCVYLDLENPADRTKLSDPQLFFTANEDALVVLDEIHRMPEVFQTLRGVIDRGRHEGNRTGRFLILGSASIDLIQQSGESLAGRIAYIELGPVDVTEIEATPAAVRNLWLRGGFPDSLLAADDASSLEWRMDFIRTYLERDIPDLRPKIPAETLRRFWTMLAHTHGGLLNAATLAQSLGVSAQSVARYVDLLVDLLLVRRLMPHHDNLGKRLFKSPKLYIRDSGLLHALLGIPNYNNLLGQPLAGMSWEGMVIENLIAAAPAGARASFYRTAVGAEIDLLLRLPNGDLWAIEVKSGLTPKIERGFHHARADLKPAQSFIVYSGNDRFPLAEGIDAIGLNGMAKTLLALSP